jgi:hypothetical protein
MTEPPRRLSEEANAPGSALLRAAQSEAPPSTVLERTLAAVAAASAASLVPTAAAAKTVKSGTALALKYALLGFATGVVVVGGAEAIHHAATRPSASATSAPAIVASGQQLGAAAAREAASASAGVGVVDVWPGPSATETSNLPFFPEETADSGNRAVSRRAARAETDSVRAIDPRAIPSGAVPSVEADSAMEVEVRLLDEARTRLAEGRGRDALAVLGRYAREAPSQRLAPEAWYLEMEANHALGDRTAAMRSAQGLLERYPDGPHAARAKKILRGE